MASTADLKLRMEAMKEFQSLFQGESGLINFAHIAMEFMGFSLTPVQDDILRYLYKGGNRLMVQAQRGQAKTTVTGIYATWELGMNPTNRILILSAAETRCKEISKMIIDMITTMPELQWLSPDSRGRRSVDSFDVYQDFKGVDKSPNLACLGIGSTIEGARADILIADDVESHKNSRTATMRELLIEITRGFTSICSKGKILFLGTPQSKDSVYNTLPGRGYRVRIWTGRVPTDKEAEDYGDLLAPSIRNLRKQRPDLCTGYGPTGESGAPLDSVILGEEDLIQKEIDQGRSYFQLQHMLNTAVLDEGLYPLSTSDLVFMSINPEQVPDNIVWQPSPQNAIDVAWNTDRKTRFYRAESTSSEFIKLDTKIMFIDPAGGGSNGDETGYAVMGISRGRFFLLDCGGVPGGYTESVYNELCRVACQWEPKAIYVEKNYGGGAFEAAILPYLKRHGFKGGVESWWNSTQKETRIIEAMEACLSKHALIVNESLLESDYHSTKKYDVEKQKTYQLFFQMSHITRVKGSLSHDDRLEAVAMCIHIFMETLSREAQVVKTEQQRKSFNELIKTRHPGYGRDNKVANNIVNRNRVRHRY